LFANAKQLTHLLVQESLSGAVGLHPFSVYYELRDGALAGVLDDFFGCARGGFYVDLAVGDIVLGQEALGFSTVATPGGRVNNQFHTKLDVVFGFWIQSW
jgi:hypothetical protein